MGKYEDLKIKEQKNCAAQHLGVAGLNQKGLINHRHPGLDPGSSLKSKPVGGSKSGIPDQVRDDEGREATTASNLAKA
ncbi:MAG: hypothetical protein ACT6QT_06845 [Sphingopyxis sp.]|uniref:hypothetical protein n=1 Tax=Sphingopyxis sp. TaxID=1908224 RepID=UPI003F6E88BD